ncbi:MAG: Plug domain-containing protein, partial [Paraperlucidibaca sp.]
MRPIKQHLTNHRQPLALAIAALAASLSTPAWAEHVLPAVTVSADAQNSAFSLSPAQALSELQKAPGGVSVVDAQDYLTGRAGTMEDTLKLAPGVFIASRFGSDEARISIRGSGLQRTFHGRGLLLLQDGVPLNLADGGFDMQAIEPQATRYIEVERGANALRYGGSTLGGAINYVSETGRSSPA